MNIFVCLPVNAAQQARLRAALPQHDLHICASEDFGDADRMAFGDCPVVFGNPPAEWVATSKNLKWVQLESVGFGEYVGLDWASLGKRVSISNLAGFFAEPVAESILAGVLGLLRGTGALAQMQTGKTWRGGAYRSELGTLKGARVVLFGRGAINGRLVELLAPFDCSITSFGRDWTKESLEAALAMADVVACTVPDHPKTRNLFDRHMIGTIKRGAIFANFGRGSLVDENALADALESDHLRGAVLDVTREEPLPFDHRFWTVPHLLLTQHTAGGTADEMDRKVDVFLANLARFETGMPCEGFVDFLKE